MSPRAVCSSLILLIASLAAPVAKADTVENLLFTGTAACQSGFVHQECTPGSMGPLTGTYTLDVTTQQIVGPWAFTSPFFASLSSSDPGASGRVFDGVMNGGISYDVVEFSEETSSFNEVLSFGFTGANALVELGPISTPAPISVIISGICQSVPGSSPAECEPDVNIAGATTIPEPSSVALIGPVIAVLGALLWFKRRASKGSILF